MGFEHPRSDSSWGVLLKRKLSGADAACLGALSQVTSMPWKKDATNGVRLVCCRNQQFPKGFPVKQAL